MNNELTVYQQESGQEATFLAIRMDSRKYPRLCRMSREEAIGKMYRIVAQAFLYKGQAADQNNIQFISTALVDELLLEDRWGAKYLSIEEIGMIVKSAVLGEVEMFGISVASLYKVIIDWVKGEGTRIQEKANKNK